MAGKTVVLRSSRGMALAAVSVCTAVVHWEGVVEGCPAPGRGVVALRTLSTEVVGRLISRVTGFAISGRLVTAMACFAVSGSHCLVVEIGLRPIRRIVTG